MIKKLSNLTTKKNIRTFSVSPENLTGEKGKGGMATYGSASYAARELGQGWKMNPYLVSEAGSTLTLADASGTLRPTMVAVNVYISVRHCRTPFLFFILYYLLFYTGARASAPTTRGKGNEN